MPDAMVTGFDKELPQFNKDTATSGFLPSDRTEDTSTSWADPLQPREDSSLQTDGKAIQTASDYEVQLVRITPAKATARTLTVAQTVAVQLLPMDLFRKRALISVPSAVPCIIGPESEINNYVGQGTLAAVSGVMLCPGQGTNVITYQFEYTGSSELWVLSATAAATTVTVLNETYGGGPIVG
jgi:hypothetical protein